MSYECKSVLRPLYTLWLHIKKTHVFFNKSKASIKMNLFYCQKFIRSFFCVMLIFLMWVFLHSIYTIYWSCFTNSKSCIRKKYRIRAKSFEFLLWTKMINVFKSSFGMSFLKKIGFPLDHLKMGLQNWNKGTNTAKYRQMNRSICYSESFRQN